MRSSLKGTVEWIAVEKPTEQDFTFLERTFALSPEIRHIVRRPVLRPRIITEKTFRSIVVHVPRYHETKRHSHSVEIDILISEGMIATVAMGEVKPLRDLLKRIRKDEALQKRLLGKTPEHVLFEILTQLLVFVDHQLDHIQEKLELFERDITNVHHKGFLETLAVLRGDILDVRRIIKPEREVFEDLAERDGIRWQTLLSEYDRVFDRVENHKETIEALYETFTALVSVRANEIVRILTIIATITLPLALFTSLFGMNAAHIPIIGLPYDFWIIFGIIVAATIGMLAFFRKLRWF
jgi:magnesium transporter